MRLHTKSTKRKLNGEIYIKKKILLFSGFILSILIISGLPAYYISSLSGPISQQAICLYIWGLFSAPSGIIALVWLNQWYKEKKIFVNRLGEQNI